MNEELYQEQIIELSKKADHSQCLDKADCSCTLSNPLCGDRIAVEMQMDGEKIKSIACQVRGCMLCKASTSVLLETVRGMTLAQIKRIAFELTQALRSSSDEPECFPVEYRMFYPVRTRKSRHSCVMLPIDAVVKAISEYVKENDK
jgi:nitrogen fixation protein NifU and related proteins